MYPQVFLKTFWRLELRPQIFVAMDFDNKYKPRFDDIIAPAISSIRVDNVPLKPYRVDISKSGDSILTDIIDGIAHCQMVLADVSSVGKDSVTSRPYRNANVMYEVGLAVACRQPTEVLLIRDDRDKFLFDVSTIPHMTIDFTDNTSAIATLRGELIARLKERNYINDARVQLAIASLSNQEAKLLKDLADLPLRHIWGIQAQGIGRILGELAVSRLLDKQLMKVAGEFEDQNRAYEPTPLGRVVAELVKSHLRQFTLDVAKDEDREESEQGPGGDV